jgi:hypothetical protein
MTFGDAGGRWWAMLDTWDALAAGLATFVREFLPHHSRGTLPVRLPAGAGRVVGVFGLSEDGHAWALLSGLGPPRARHPATAMPQRRLSQRG